MLLQNTKQVKLSVVFKDASDNIVTAPVGVPIWASSNEAVVVLVTDADGLGTNAKTVDGAVGSSTVSVTLGALRGELVIDVNAVGGGDATQAVIVVGPITDK